jgi:hypothetical protein
MAARARTGSRRITERLSLANLLPEDDVRRLAYIRYTPLQHVLRVTLSAAMREHASWINRLTRQHLADPNKFVPQRRPNGCDATVDANERASAVSWSNYVRTKSTS